MSDTDSATNDLTVRLAPPERVPEVAPQVGLDKPEAPATRPSGRPKRKSDGYKPYTWL